MNKSPHRIREGSQKPKTSLVEGKIQYLLSFEEQLLQAISTRALLPGILNQSNPVLPSIARLATCFLSSL